ncbi:DNA polymerase IV [Streptomyces albireticuli]|uniref:DNA polymerase IV n=1 Tax=Streptomyces albireticuli TaxID=1940 RepID=UPI001F290A48|nr:DNA polymerase IV [Streptomyces albireticuli]
MRAAPTILHLDMDAFYASAEQAAKPSLRGKPVVVGGIGPRGVVATASYEARVFGVRSAMATAQARRLCPNAAYLTPRFPVYRQVSEVVMGLLGALSPLVEPLSLDEAFVDLEAGGVEPSSAAVRAVGERLRRDILAATGLTGSVGLAGSKMLAKIASEQAKPDGLVLIEPGTERELLGPMSVRAVPGVGPATAEALRRSGITTVAETAEAGEAELVRLLGKAHGTGLFALATGHDDRPVVAERDAKSVSVEDTFEEDVTDRTRVQLELARLADRCVQRLRSAGRSGRTVVIKVRRYDFSTLTRSETLRGPTDDPGVVREAAARLLDGVDTTAGVRLLGVGVTGLADYTQEDLFAQAASEAAAAVAELPPPEGADRPAGEAAPEAGGEGAAAPERPRRWLPGLDVRHSEYGAGWIQGSGVGRVTVRFEQPWSEPGRVRTFAVDDPALEPAEPLPLIRAEAAAGAEDPVTAEGPAREEALPGAEGSSRAEAPPGVEALTSGAGGALGVDGLAGAGDMSEPGAEESSRAEALPGADGPSGAGDASGAEGSSRAEAPPGVEALTSGEGGALGVDGLAGAGDMSEPGAEESSRAEALPGADGPSGAGDASGAEGSSRAEAPPGVEALTSGEGGALGVDGLAGAGDMSEPGAEESSRAEALPGADGPSGTGDASGAEGSPRAEASPGVAAVRGAGAFPGVDGPAGAGDVPEPGPEESCRVEAPPGVDGLPAAGGIPGTGDAPGVADSLGTDGPLGLGAAPGTGALPGPQGASGGEAPPGQGNAPGGAADQPPAPLTVPSPSSEGAPAGGGASGVGRVSP